MPIEFKELAFSDPRVQVDEENGLIWKPVLRAGKWAIGPNGSPLHVIPGRSVDQRKAIGLQDIVDNFDKIEHVTIPLSHDDKVDENTGMIKKVAIKSDPGGDLLMAAHKFTEPEIEGKVRRGTIPNTSVGLEFDYMHKESGKKIPVVLKHVALTHRPWINKLKPFGVAASDDNEYVVESLHFSEPDKPEEIAHFSVDAWNANEDIEKIRERIASRLGDGFEPVTMARDSVLVKDKVTNKHFVVNYSTDGDEVKVDARDSWVEHDTTPPSSDVVPPATDPPANIPPTTDPPKEIPVVTPPTKTEVEQLREQLAAAETRATEERAARERLEGTVTSLAERDRLRDTDGFVDALKSAGLSEEKGWTPFLKFVRDLRLSDSGAATIMLAEDGNDTPTAMTATGIIEAMIAKFPTDEKTGKLKLALSEQHEDPLGVSPRTRPPRVADDEVVLAEGSPEFDTNADELYNQLFPGDPLPTPAAS